MRVRRGVLSALVAASVVVLPSAAAVPGTPGPSGPGAGHRDSRVAVVAGCKVFPADNYWNTRVDDLAVHPRSGQWLRHMAPRSRLHPDFGPSFGEQPVPYG